MPLNKPPKNKAESKFVNRARYHGWTAVRAGWPDFLLVRKGEGKGYEFLAVEVKRNFTDDGLKPEQMVVTNALRLMGVPCKVYSLEDEVLRDPEMVDCPLDQWPGDFHPDLIPLAEDLRRTTLIVKYKRDKRRSNKNVKPADKL